MRRNLELGWNPSQFVLSVWLILHSIILTLSVIILKWSFFEYIDGKRDKELLEISKQIALASAGFAAVEMAIIVITILSITNKRKKSIDCKRNKSAQQLDSSEPASPAR